MAGKTRAIRSVHGRGIFDSRGRPTVEVDVTLHDGSTGRAAVPSGASTGTAEAHELRDGDASRYGGRGVTTAVANVGGEIATALVGVDAFDQPLVDRTLRELDGTPNLARLGANAVLGVSLACARAAAGSSAVPVHRYLRRLADDAGLRAVPSMPLPMVNILSGGMHAGGGMDVQDFLAVPVGAHDLAEALSMIWRVRESASVVLAKRGRSILQADEGGLSPGFRSSEEALEAMMDAVTLAGLTPGRDVAIALDMAATGLWDAAAGRYVFRRADRSLTSGEVTDMVGRWIANYPIVSVEDPLHDEDWDAWSKLTKRLGTIQLVGDDLFVTQAARIARGANVGAGNCALIKVNQNGTLTGTLEALRAAQDAGYAAVVSARSGETEDTFIADLAVATGCGQIKIGSFRTSERLAKYNQLIRLAEDIGDSLNAAFVR